MSMNHLPTDHSKTDLRGRTFAGQDLTGANFAKADLRTLPDPDSPTTADSLLRTDFTETMLSQASFAGARANRALFIDADLSDSDLTRADLTQANLTGANLTGANLTGANLAGADLSGADLTGATVTNTNFSLSNRAGLVGLQEA